MKRLPTWAWILAALTLLRLALAAAVPASPEEAYHWNYARHLDWSYYDHPPMVAWVIAFGRAIAGDTPLGIRLGFVLLSIATGALLARAAGRLYGPAAAAWAVGLTLFEPLPLLIGIAGFPDAPLQCFWTLAMVLILEALRSGRGAWWVGAGVALGAGMLSKYTMAFLPISLVGFLALSKPHRRWLARPWPWLGVVVALAVFTPVFAWNAQHDWASFRFQAVERLQESDGFEPRGAWTFFVGQVLGFAPLTFPLAAVGIVRAFRSDRPEERLLAWWFAPMTLFFFAVSFFRNVHLLWPAPAWIPLTLLMAGALGGLQGRLAAWYSKRRVPLAALPILGVLLGAIHLVWFIPGWGPAKHIYGWKEVAAKVRSLKPQGAFYVGLGRKYTTTSMLALYLNEPQNVHGSNVLGLPALQYGYWVDPEDLAGRDAVAVIEEGDRLAGLKTYLERHFVSVEEADQISVPVGRPPGRFPPRKWRIFVARGYRPPASS